MRTAIRLCTLAVVALLTSNAVAQSTSNAAMGSAGASGGVTGGSAVAGAQGANSRGAADGGGPNLSPVIPSGSRTAPTNNAASQFNNSIAGGMVAPSNAAVGNLNSRPSTRQRFGTAATMRGSDRNLVQPNRTYRSDLGAWQVIGPMEPGVDTTAYSSNIVGNGGYRSTFTYDAEPYASQSAGAIVADASAPNAVAPLVSSSARSNSLAPAASFGAAPPSGEPQGDAALLSNTTVTRPNLGIRMAAGFTGSGAQVTRIGRNSPAALAGLRRGDVLTSVNGLGVYSYSDVVAAMESAPPLGSIEIIVWRGGQSVPLTVHFAANAPRHSMATATFDPSRTSAAESLARIESLMSEVQSELQQLRVHEAGH